MMTITEAIGFEKCVVAAFDNEEFIENWKRLRKIENIDSRKGRTRFIKDVRSLIWDRLPQETRESLCA